MVFKFSCLRKLFLIFAVLTSSSLTGYAGGTVPGDGADVTPVSEDYYKQFTFEWTDSEGNTHQSDITEEATEFNHIVALIKKIYLDPLIPGYTRDITAEESSELINDPTRIEQQFTPYGPCTAEPYNMDADLKVEQPVSGATALLVEMKDSYNSQISNAKAAIEAIKSVKLISKQLYVGKEDSSTNPGFLFNVETTLNKFFIITKGSIRRASAAPFYTMFEEFSPSNKKPIENAYARMEAGEQFPVDHNCVSVIGQRHDIVMSEIGNPKEYSVNLMFFLPDLRFYGETRYQPADANKYEHYTFYSKDYQPFFFFNQINAKIDAPVNLDSESHIAEVPVSWVSTYKDITRSKVPERFIVYRVVDDVREDNPIPADQIIVRQDDTTQLEDGSLVRSEDNTVRIYVKEAQHETTRQVSYVILGRRHYSEFSFVESNVVKASIPGYSEFETLQIVIDGHAKSAYDLEAQVNRYENTINLTDTPGAGGHKLLNGHISVRKGDIPGTIFELRRYTSGNDDNFSVVATMEVTKQEPDYTWNNGSEGVHVFNGTITYPEGTDTDGLPLSCRFKSKMDIGNPSNDPLQPIIAVDGMGGVIAKFVDRFEASTARGEQPRNYHYRIVYQAAQDIVPGNNGRTAVSNAVSVAIPLREFSAGYAPYSLEQVLADDNALTRLPLNPVGVAVTAAKNQAIVGYDITHVNSGKVIAEALRSPSGIFQMRVLTPSGEWDSNLNPQTEASFSGKLPIILAENVNANDELALTIVYENGNTYGNPYARLTPIPRPTIDKMSLECYGGLTGGIFQYRGELYWTSSDLSVRPWPAFPDKTADYKIFGHHVWSRNDCPDGMNEYEVIHRPESSRPISGISGGNAEYVFDSSHKASPEMPVTNDHIVRLYAKVPAELLMAPAGVKEGYVLAETTDSTDLDNTGIVSGIGDIDEDSPTATGSVRLLDIHGREVKTSDTPSPGIYIRITGDRAEKILIP